jgi:RNA polymerase sigma-70 factor (ECF subfamily)
MPCPNPLRDLGDTRVPSVGMQPAPPAVRIPVVVPIAGHARRARHAVQASDPYAGRAVTPAAGQGRVVPLRARTAAEPFDRAQPELEPPGDDGCDPGVDEDPAWSPPADDGEQASAAPTIARGEAGRLATADDATLAAWIDRIVERDERALEALYDATAGRVLGAVRRVVRDSALAEEVVEDTFWQVWRQAPRFDAARGRAVTWLLAIARSRAIDALRRDQRFAHDELPEDDRIDDAAGLDPRELLQSDRARAALLGALDALDARSRQLVSLAFLRGLTHEEIAAQCALPLGTVKSLIRRALQQLRQKLEAGHA